MELRRRASMATAFLVLGGLVVAGAPARASVDFELVVDGLQQPVFITHAGDGSGRLFIVEKFGAIHIYQDGALLPEPFIDITPKVASAGGADERGLLSMAFAPGFPDDDRVYLCYSATVDTQDFSNLDPTSPTVVARYHVDSDDPNKLDPDSAEVLFSQTQPFPNHNGGQCEFGPDGFLYVGLGDGGLANDLLLQSQNPNSPLGFLGHIIRIDVSGEGGYTVPPSNPHVGDPTAHDETWAFGLRNPWRFSFDAKTGDLYIADVGQNEWEEVNVQPADSPGGENYGWPVYEGNHSFRPEAEVVATVTSPTANRDYVFPVHEYDHSDGKCSITGGYVYRNGDPDDPENPPTIPEIYGKYVFGEYCEGTIWALSKNEQGDYEVEVLVSTGLALGISSFGVDEEGEIYVAHLGIGFPDVGAVYKLVPGE